MDRADEAPSGTGQGGRAPVTGPSGGYNQRDLDVAERPVDAFEAVELALSYGLRAVVLKNHYEPTAAQLVGAFVVALLERGFTETELDLMMKENPARLLGLSAR